MRLNKNLPGLVILLIWLILSPALDACTIKITPEKSSGAVGDEIKVTVGVFNQHIPCRLDIDATQITVTGATITNQTAWLKKTATQYEKTLTIKLTTPPKAQVNVQRTCDIKTSQASAQIEITGNLVSDFKTVSQSVKESSNKLLEELAKLSLMRSTLETLSATEKDPATKKKITDLAAKLDSVFKYSQKLANKCSLLLKH